MSSVTRFLRQRQVGTRALTLTVAPANLYVFIAGSGNYVGNYPANGTGWMVPFTVAGAGITNASGAVVFSGDVYARDMGKTITAAVGSSATTAPTTSTPGAFRQVQVLFPTTVASATAASSFGVQGQVPGTFTSGNAGDDGYNTFYIPEVLGGVLASNAGGTAVVTQPTVTLAVDGQL